MEVEIPGLHPGQLGLSETRQDTPHDVALPTRRHPWYVVDRNHPL